MTEQEDEPFATTRAQFVRCPLCGYNTSDTPPPDLPAALTQAAREWSEWLVTVLDHPGGLDELALRPEPENWSALEIACHVRDLLAVNTRWILRMIVEDVPELPHWDAEAAVVADNYVDQDPAFVASDIVVNARDLVDVLQVLTGSAWLRRGRSDGIDVTLVGLGRLVLHELRHHLQDAQDMVAPELP